MKRQNLFLITGIIVLNLFSYDNVFSQEITRGPDIGEIYFMGPTTTVLYDAIYRSTDFGETAVCVDSVSTLSNTIVAIAADKTLGSLYFVTMGEALYYSGGYGQYGSWELRSGGIYNVLLSGVNEGFIFEGAASHSENYGYNFINHSASGAFGQMQAAELDVQENTCYLLTMIWGQIDTMYLFKSDDYYETMELQNRFYRYEEPIRYLSRGSTPGELYTYIDYENSMLRFSNDFGYSWQTKNVLYFNNYATVDFTGGRQPGEVYFIVTYIQLMGQIKHIYIYHSLDYGETFAIYHPFAFGPDPFYVAFNAEPKTGNIPLSVQFNDESSGENLSWEWDFQNDGTIDSYEQNPTFTYYDIGYYDVKLTLSNSYNQYSLVKNGYIHVKDTTTGINLRTGYQFISSNRSPENPDMLEVLGNNLNDNLDFVRNSQGQMLQKIGENWVNGIGDWISTEGYLFKMMEQDVLIIDGTAVNPQTPIYLNTGYQFVSYLPNETLDALEAFASILNDDLDFIRNSEGGVLRKIGPNWVNGIGFCEAGEGFLVKMNGEGVLVYP